MPHTAEFNTIKTVSILSFVDRYVVITLLPLRQLSAQFHLEETLKTGFSIEEYTNEVAQ